MDIVVDAPPQRPGIPKWLIPAIGYVVSAVTLVWVFSRFPYAQLEDHLRTLDWAWVALAIVIEIGVYFADAWRWYALLQPAGAPSFGACLQSVFVGLFANDVLPARTGELIRCFLLSYESDVHLPLAFTSDIILRMMDGLWIVIIYLIVTFQVGSHQVVTDVMWGFSAVVLAISLALLFVLFRRQHAHEFIQTRGWAARFNDFLEELHNLGHWRELGLAMFGSGIYWLTQALAIWALARADAFDFGVGAAAFLLVVKAVGTLIPNAPANVGAYQAAMMYAMGLLLVERANAQIFSQLAFWMLTIPALVGGAIAVAVTGFDIKDLHLHAKRAHEVRSAKKAMEPGQL
jgi:uncharacterized protein (TIRG00374 family)